MPEPSSTSAACWDHMTDSAAVQAAQHITEAVKVLETALGQQYDPLLDEAHTEALIALGTLRRAKEGR